MKAGAITSLKPTGERLLPGLMDQDVEIEHWQRYLFSLDLVAGKNVLDIASGEGYGSALLASVAESVVGVDIDNDAVFHANATYAKKNLRYLQGTCDNIPLPDRSVDAVVSFETIEHHDRHNEMMREIKRVLKPGGVCIISTPDRTYSEQEGYANPYHVKELSVEEFKSLLASFFRNSRLYAQKYMVGSLLIPTGASKSSFQFARQAQTGSMPKFQELELKYIVAVASDGNLPEPCNTFLENSHFWAKQREENERVNRLLGEMGATLRSQEAERDGLQNAVVSLTGNVCALQAERDVYRGAANDRALKWQGARDALASLTETIEALQAERDAFRASANDRAAERDGLEIAVASLTGTVEALQAECDAHRGAADARALEVRATRDALASLTETIEALQAERDAFRASANDRAAERDGLQIAVASLTGTVEAAQAERDAHRAAANTCAFELQGARDAFAALTETIEALQAERDAFRASANDRAAERDGLQIAVASLTGTVEAAQTETRRPPGRRQRPRV